MNGSNNVKSVIKALTLFNILVENGEAMALSSLSDKTGINISTVYRLLNTMASMGYVTQNENDKYCIGSYAYKIADTINNSFDIKEFVHPYLVDIVDICNETAHLSVLQNNHLVYLDQVESSNILKIVVDTNEVKPAYCTAAGKVMLAFKNKLDLRKYLEETEFIQYSKNTVTEPAILNQILKKIKEEKYAVAIEEYEEGVISVAAPILDKNKKIQGTISISGPCSRINSYILKNTFIPLIKNKAREISENLSRKVLIA